MAQLPVYDVSLDPMHADEGEDLGISQIAATANPAIYMKGLAFSNDEQKRMCFTDSTKMRVIAPIMIPMQIYRLDNEEYYVRFTKEIIEDLYKKFQSRGTKVNVFNLDHEEEKQAYDKTYILESWIVEEGEDKSHNYGLNPPVGSVMIIAQHTDPEYYKKEIVEAGRTGFSIEGFLGLKLVNDIKSKQNKMSAVKLETHQDASGCKFFVDGDIAIDSYVYTDQPTHVLVDGKRSEIKYPWYGNIIEMTDGTVLTLADSKIVEITKKEQVQMSTKKKFEAAMLEDGTPIWIEKKEVGSDVFVIDENMERAPIFDGEHKVKDYGVIVTVDGKITELKPKVEAADEVVKEEEKVEEVKAAEEVIDETKTVTEEPITEDRVLAIIQPKLDEIYAVIAEMKAAWMDEEVDEETEIVDSEYKAVQTKLAALNKLDKYLKSR